MNTVLKQRLVGALVLIALGVVFWPVIFIEPEQQPLDRTRQVPPMPSVEIPDLAQPQPVKGLEPPRPTERQEKLPVDALVLHEAPPLAIDEAQLKTSALAGAEQPVSDDVAPTLDENGIPVAWILQVASMSQRDKADALQRDLVAQGYDANVKVIKRGEQRLYRVTVGPKFDKNRMQSIKKSIDARYKVDAIVARYLP